MTSFLVAWVAWTCPGGWFGGLVPAQARPLVCQPTAKVEPYDRLERARKRVVELGKDSAPKLIEVRGLRHTELPVTWVTEARF
jgi:hypothetical protein